MAKASSTTVSDKPRPRGTNRNSRLHVAELEAEVAALRAENRDLRRAALHMEDMDSVRAQLRACQERFRELAGGIPQVFWIVDPHECRVIYVSPAYPRIWGRGSEAVNESVDAWIEAIHPDDRARVVEEALTEGCHPFDVTYRVPRAGGEERIVHDRGWPLRDPTSGKVRLMVGIAEDVTERCRAERALRESEARWRGLFERMHEGFALCELVRDAEGVPSDWRYVEVNAAWERLVGVPAALARGRLASEVLPGVDPSWTARLARVVETGEPLQAEALFAHLGRWFSVMAYSAEPGRFASLFLDVTDRKASEERQALLAREVDHRAKNALAVVQSVVHLTPAQEPVAFRRAIEGRIAALARAQSLLAGDKWRGADLHALLKGEIAAFRSDGQRVTLEGPCVMLPSGAAQPMAMAVHELATNAVKHGGMSAPGGSVAISWYVEQGSPDRLHLRWAETGGPSITGKPQRRGFGTRVLQGTVASQLGGTVEMDWRSDGVVCTLSVPLRGVPTPPEGPGRRGGNMIWHQSPRMTGRTRIARSKSQPAAARD